MKTVFIYALKDPRDGAVKYIGKAKDPKKRLKEHSQEAKKRVDRTHKNNWICSLLSAGLFPEMEILDEVPDTQQNFFERAYIKVYRESGFKLTNGTDGGDGGATTTGRKMPPEQCAAISASKRGVPWSPEHRANLKPRRVSRAPKSEEHKKKISDTLLEYYTEHESPMLGYKHTPETCEKNSASHKGQRPSDAAISAARAVTKGVPRTPEHKAKMSAALKRVWAERKAKNVLR